MPAAAAAVARSSEEQVLLAALRNHDERAFAALLDRYHNSLLRLARMYVPTAAEDVVQDTWLGVIQGLDRFEGRSSLKTWIFSILINRAKTRAHREGRQIPFSALWDAGADPAEPAVQLERFLEASHEKWPHHWASPPRSWGESAEEKLLTRETQALIRKAIDALPPNQREVITLRDIEGWTAEEVCNVLGVSETNQRVLLHRARSKVRGALEEHLAPPEYRNEVA